MAWRFHFPIRNYDFKCSGRIFIYILNSIISRLTFDGVQEDGLGSHLS